MGRGVPAPDVRLVAPRVVVDGEVEWGTGDQKWEGRVGHTSRLEWEACLRADRSVDVLSSVAMGEARGLEGFQHKNWL